MIPLNDLPLFQAAATAEEHARNRSNIHPLPAERRQASTLVPTMTDIGLFPPSRNQRLVFTMADRFMKIRPSPKRGEIFTKRHMDPIGVRWRALGISELVIRRELRELERAICRRLDVLIFPEKHQSQETAC